MTVRRQRLAILAAVTLGIVMILTAARNAGIPPRSPTGVYQSH